MTEELRSGRGRKWIEEWAGELASDPEDLLELVLEVAREAAERGVLALPGRDAEESRALYARLIQDDRPGLQVPAPEGGEDDELVQEAKASLERALDEQKLEGDTQVTAFRLGVGAGTGAAIIVIVAAIVSILKDGPKAWSTVRRWAAALRKAAGSSDHYSMNVATLKLLCVDEALRLHPDLQSIESTLITATVALGNNPDTEEQHPSGPVYVVVPLAELSLTYVFAVDWDGKILQRASMAYEGPSSEELAAQAETRALRESND